MTSRSVSERNCQAIWDQLSVVIWHWDHIDTVDWPELLAPKLLQMTEFYVQRMRNTSNVSYQGIDVDPDRCLKKLHASGRRWGLMVRSGTFLFGNDRIVEQLSQLAHQNDWMVSGHIIDHEHRSPGLHNQLVFVDLLRWHCLGRPVWGRSAKLWQRWYSTNNYETSRSHVYKDYTPLWLKPQSGTRVVREKQEGWGLIEASLKAGLSVYNFNNIVRERKAHLHPKQGPHELYRAWVDPSDENLAALQDQQQRWWLRKIRDYESQEKSRVYAFNTEHTSTRHIHSGKLDVLVTVAAGLKPIRLLIEHGYHKDTRVWYFDFCRHSLAWRQRLLEWTGNDYANFLEQHREEYQFTGGHWSGWPQQWQNELEDMRLTPTQFQEHWERIRQLDHQYIHTDLIHEPKHMINILESARQLGTTAVWWSNIFSSELVWWRLDKEYIEQQWNTFYGGLQGLDIICYGNDAYNQSQ